MTRGELAQLLNKKANTVDHWFSQKSPLEPPPDVLRRLDEINARFTQWQIEDELIPQIRQLYELLKDRRQQSDND